MDNSDDDITGGCRAVRAHSSEEAKSTTWLHPVTGEAVITGHRKTPDLPPGWEEGYTFEGARCFINHNEQKVTCKHPVSGLPSQDTCIFILNEQPVPKAPASSKKDRPMSTMTDTSNYTSSSDYIPHPGSPPGRPSRSSKKVHNFGKRSNSIKRNPNAPVVRSGWLYKQDSTGMKLWKKRWFVLSDMCLFYYRDEKEEGILGSILLPSFHISMLSVEDHISKKYAFKATHPNMRTYYFCTDMARDMEVWMKAMTDAALVHIEPMKRQKLEHCVPQEMNSTLCRLAPPQPEVHIKDGPPETGDQCAQDGRPADGERDGERCHFQTDGAEREKPRAKARGSRLQPSQAAAIVAAVMACSHQENGAPPPQPAQDRPPQMNGGDCSLGEAGTAPPLRAPICAMPQIDSSHLQGAPHTDPAQSQAPPQQESAQSQPPLQQDPAHSQPPPQAESAQSQPPLQRDPAHSQPPPQAESAQSQPPFQRESDQSQPPLQRESAESQLPPQEDSVQSPPPPNRDPAHSQAPPQIDIHSQASSQVDSSHSQVSQQRDPIYYQTLPMRDSTNPQAPPQIDPTHSQTSLQRDPCYYQTLPKRDSTYAQAPPQIDSTHSQAPPQMDPTHSQTSFQRDPSYSQTLPKRDHTHSQTSLQRDPSYSQTLPKRDHTHSQAPPQTDHNYSQAPPQESEKSLQRTSSMQQLEQWVRIQRGRIQEDDTESVASYLTLPRKMPSQRSQGVPRYPEGYRTLPRNSVMRPDSICSLAPSLYDRALGPPASSAEKRRSMRDDTMWQLYEWRQRQTCTKHAPSRSSYSTLPNPRTLIRPSDRITPSIPLSPSHGSLAHCQGYQPYGSYATDGPPALSSRVHPGVMTMDRRHRTHVTQYVYPPDRRNLPSGIQLQPVTTQSLQGKTPEELTLLLIKLRRQQAELSSARQHTIAQLLQLSLHGNNPKNEVLSRHLKRNVQYLDRQMRENDPLIFMSHTMIENSAPRPQLYQQTVPEDYRDNSYIYRQGSLDLDVKLSRLCEQDKVVRTQEHKLQQLYREKHTLETALLAASQEIEMSAGDQAALQSVVQQRDLLQSGLLSTCRELARVNTALERSWRDFSQLETDVTLIRNNLLEQLEALGTPQTEPPSQQHVQIQKELWRIQDVTEALSKNRTQRSTEAPSVVNSNAAPSQPTSEEEDSVPPRPPLPQYYDIIGVPPAGGAHRPAGQASTPRPDDRKHGQRNGTHSGPDYRLCKSEPELTTVTEVEESNTEDKAEAAVDKEPSGTKGLPYPVGVVSPRTKSPLTESSNITSYVTLRKSKKPDPRTDRPHSAAEQAGQAETGRPRMSVEEQLERIRRHQEGTLRGRKKPPAVVGVGSENFRTLQSRKRGEGVPSDIQELLASLRGKDTVKQKDPVKEQEVEKEQGQEQEVEKEQVQEPKKEQAQEQGAEKEQEQEAKKEQEQEQEVEKEQGLEQKAEKEQEQEVRKEQEPKKEQGQEKEAEKEQELIKEEGPEQLDEQKLDSLKEEAPEQTKGQEQGLEKEQELEQVEEQEQESVQDQGPVEEKDLVKEQEQTKAEEQEQTQVGEQELVKEPKQEEEPIGEQELVKKQEQGQAEEQVQEQEQVEENEEKPVEEQELVKEQKQEDEPVKEQELVKEQEQKPVEEQELVKEQKQEEPVEGQELVKQQVQAQSEEQKQEQVGEQEQMPVEEQALVKEQKQDKEPVEDQELAPEEQQAPEQEPELENLQESEQMDEPEQEPVKEDGSEQIKEQAPLQEQKPEKDLEEEPRNEQAKEPAQEQAEEEKDKQGEELVKEKEVVQEQEQVNSQDQANEPSKELQDNPVEEQEEDMTNKEQEQPLQTPPQPQEQQPEKKLPEVLIQEEDGIKALVVKNSMQRVAPVVNSNPELKTEEVTEQDQQQLINNCEQKGAEVKSLPALPLCPTPPSTPPQLAEGSHFMCV
ncbi:pleckstrin homology domain-containing family A member 5-like isoform X3 [Anguilla anguilla]|uniref:pleckstrin homology domain-containing family A member 5-like isoform X3 n=1 Tax=Anguilla anguilla TaxID=7936 RepID=UPI0015B2DCBF|nr:pleckstrin homology domain-containing family A member 5-like isoform X3 [Anguilla anguilla]